MHTDVPEKHNNIDACVNALLAKMGKNIVLGLPLGLGKPIRLANALYERAQADPSLKLHIVTALSLNPPGGGSSLEKRFLGPFVQRLYGEIPELKYARDVTRQNLPENVTVSEFFFKAGTFLNNSTQQRRYISTNYTHAVRDLLGMGVNVLGQMVAPSPDDEGVVSLSCNPDLTLDLIPLMRQAATPENPVAIVGELNRQLPFMGNDAAVPASDFDFLLEQPKTDYPLFSAPLMSISPEDHMIGFYASTLLKDGGTLQVGIGSLGDALVHSAILRHQKNPRWKAFFERLKVAEKFPVVNEVGGTNTFEQGLYGCSEMMVDGFLHLLQSGVLKREVFDHAGLQEIINEGLPTDHCDLNTLDRLRERGLIQSPLRARDVDWLKKYGILRPEVEFKGGRIRVSNQSLDPNLDDAATREGLKDLALGQSLTGGVVMHGGFYIGPNDFYDLLRTLTPEQRQKICMTSVNFINHLYDHRFGNQRLKQAQRVEGRFINTAMMYTLSGAAVSDGLADGRVVSGVGGQYNFVAMAQEIPGGRSILALRSTRVAKGKTVSSIVFNYGHCTIPRHLRDIVITEYGIADLRGQPDEEVYLRLIRIADSRFQPELLKLAQKAGKVDQAFTLPVEWQQNLPDVLHGHMAAPGNDDLFPPFPFGCDFTEQELRIGKALKYLKRETGSTRGKLATLIKAVRASDEQGKFAELLKRMSLDAPTSLKDKLEQKLVLHGLEMTQQPSEV